MLKNRDHFKCEGHVSTPSRPGNVAIEEAHEHKPGFDASSEV